MVGSWTQLRRAVAGVAAAGSVLVALGCSSLGDGTLPVNAAGAGVTVIDGRLVDAAGQPASGQVILDGWPADEVLAALEVGEEVPTVRLDEVRAGSDGRFVLRIPGDAPLDELASGDGYFDLEVSAWGDAGDAVYSFSVQLGPDRELTITDPALEGHLPGVLELVLEPVVFESG